MIQDRSTDAHYGEKDSQLPSEHELPEEEKDLATEVAEWEAVERHRGAMRASQEVYEFIRSRIHEPTQPEWEFAVQANLAGYVDRLQELQQLGNQVNHRAPDREVELIVRARLAARRKLEKNPAYYTYAERMHATTLAGWAELRARAERANDQHGSDWPREVEEAHTAHRTALYEQAREDLRGLGAALRP